jgi:hypothetical protein
MVLEPRLIAGVEKLDMRVTVSLQRDGPPRPSRWWEIDNQLTCRQTKPGTLNPHWEVATVDGDEGGLPCWRRTWEKGLFSLFQPRILVVHPHFNGELHT